MKKVSCPKCVISPECANNPEPGRKLQNCDRCNNFGIVWVATRIVYYKENRKRVVKQVKKYNPAMSKGEAADKCLDKLINEFCETFRNPWYSNTLSISSGGFTLIPEQNFDEDLMLINIYHSANFSGEKKPLVEV